MMLQSTEESALARQIRDDLILARHAAGLSQGEVAERMGVTGSVISKFERGGYYPDPKLSTLERYAEAVGVSLTVSVQATEGVSP